MMKHSFILITSKLETRKQKIYSHKKKKKKKPEIYVFGRISRIPYDPTYDLTIFTILVQS